MNSNSRVGTNSSTQSYDRYLKKGASTYYRYIVLEYLKPRVLLNNNGVWSLSTMYLYWILQTVPHLCKQQKRDSTSTTVKMTDVSASQSSG